jgi:hypothetical protein
MGEQKIGPDGHPIPEQQGVVGAVMAPIKPKPKNAGESGAKAEGVALDKDGKPLTEEEARKLAEAGK